MLCEFSRQFGTQNRGKVLGKGLTLHQNKQTEMTDIQKMYEDNNGESTEPPKWMTVTGFVLSAMLAVYWIVLFSAGIDLSWVYLAFTTLFLLKILLNYFENDWLDWKFWLFVAFFVVNVILIVKCVFFNETRKDFFGPAFISAVILALYIKAHNEKHK